MEMDSSASQEKVGVFALVCLWLSTGLGKLKERLVETARETKKIGKDDPRKIIHSAKVGLALTLVSLFYYFQPLYDGFGAAGMWAVLTVVVVFEFSVGATLCKSLNRGLATLVAGALGLGAEYLAELSGKTGEPILLGLFVFILAAGSTFTRFFPSMKRRYDYGILIFILTFSLVAVSGYRVEEIITLAHQRLSTIIIGAATVMIISIFICPVWAGEDLHNLIAMNVDKVASFLEGFGDEYFKGHEENTNGSSKERKPAVLEGYKSVLGSKASEETLANAAWWEPCHGRFGFRHPWKQYLKVGALIRQCAYHIEALNGYINSNKKAPSEVVKKIEEPCTRMSSESGKALKELATAMKKMKQPSAAVETHVRNSRKAIDDLKRLLQTNSAAATSSSSSPADKTNLLEIIPILAVASILIDIIDCVGKVSDSIHELSNSAHFKKPKSTTTTTAPEKQQQQQHQLLHRGIVQPVNDVEAVEPHPHQQQHVVIEIRGTSQDSPETNAAAHQPALMNPAARAPQLVVV